MKSSRLFRLIALLSAVAPWSAFAGEGAQPVQEENAVPNLLVARVPTVGQQADIMAQDGNVDVDVYPLVNAVIYRHEDGTIDRDRTRQGILDLMQNTQPVRLADTPVANLPDNVQNAFTQAEEQTADDADKRVVAWRRYGPVRGYSAGVVAYNRSVYRGYYPGYTYPYYGYYNSYYKDGEGILFNYTYGVYRRTPSYHYFVYYRNK